MSVHVVTRHRQQVVPACGTHGRLVSRAKSPTSRRTSTHETISPDSHHPTRACLDRSCRCHRSIACRWRKDHQLLSASCLKQFSSRTILQLPYSIGAERSPLRRCISRVGTVYQRKFRCQLKPPHVMSDAVTYSNVSSLITSMMGATTRFLKGEIFYGELYDDSSSPIIVYSIKHRLQPASCHLNMCVKKQ